MQPNSSPAGDLLIEVLSLPTSGDELPDVTKVSGSQVIAAGFTDADANFSITLPRGLVLPPRASLSLRVRGADPTAVVDLTVAPDLLGPFGYIGTTRLPKQIPPTPAAILAQLRDAIDQNADAAGGTPALPKLTLGDCPDCIRVMENQTSFERFPYGIFFQLIAATLYAETETVGRNQTGVFNNVTRSDAPIARGDLNGPISIDEFRDALLTRPAIVGSLGLGYVLRCSQNWKFQGLALGDLVYSLPLAPGEQQQVVVEEQSTTLSVREFNSVIASDSSLATQTWTPPPAPPSIRRSGRARRAAATSSAPRRLPR